MANQSHIDIEDYANQINRAMDLVMDAFAAPSVLNKGGLGGERLIKQRVRSGMDLSGSAFPEYSEGYKKVREAAGLKTNQIDLKFSQHDGMLSHISFDTSFNPAQVEWIIDDDTKREIAGYLSESGAGTNHKLFSFWGFTEDEISKLVTLMGEEIERKLQAIR